MLLVSFFWLHLQCDKELKQLQFTERCYIRVLRCQEITSSTCCRNTFSLWTRRLLFLNTKQLRKEVVTQLRPPFNSTKTDTYLDKRVGEKLSSSTLLVLLFLHKLHLNQSINKKINKINHSNYKMINSDSNI